MAWKRRRVIQMDVHTLQQGRTEQSIYGIACGCAYRVRGCGGAGGLEASKHQHNPMKLRLECSMNRSRGSIVCHIGKGICRYSCQRIWRQGGRGRSVGIDTVNNCWADMLTEQLSQAVSFHSESREYRYELIYTGLGHLGATGYSQ
jgi:hypothetical protein